jgi:hypothetical protein
MVIKEMYLRKYKYKRSVKKLERYKKERDRMANECEQMKDTREIIGMIGNQTEKS